MPKHPTRIVACYHSSVTTPGIPKGVPFRLKDHLELVDWTGRAILENKPGYIPDHKPPALERLLVDPKHRLYITQHFKSRFKGLIGSSYALKETYHKLEFQRTLNLDAVLQLLN